MIGSYRIFCRNSIEPFKNFNKSDKILLDSGSRIYSQILSDGIQLDLMREFNETQHKRITFMFCSHQMLIFL